MFIYKFKISHYSVYVQIDSEFVKLSVAWLQILKIYYSVLILTRDLFSTVVMESLINACIHMCGVGGDNVSIAVSTG